MFSSLNYFLPYLDEINFMPSCSKKCPDKIHSRPHDSILNYINFTTLNYVEDVKELPSQSIERVPYVIEVFFDWPYGHAHIAEQKNDKIYINEPSILPTVELISFLQLSELRGLLWLLKYPILKNFKNFSAKMFTSNT